MAGPEHPFAPYVRILGRGKTLTRSLTMDEAEEAMTMILRGEVLPEQLGAFLMLLRVKEESPEEIAGFVRASRKLFDLPSPTPQVDLDWSSYAGKRRQLPWFLLAALLLAQTGTRVFMHGAEGHTPGRLYTRETLEALDIPIAETLAESAKHIEARNFAYLPLARLSPRLHAVIELRPIMGLRSPVHTIARMLNPFSAPVMLQGIFHPNYMDIHQHAAILLGQRHMCVFRGEGGEIERRPSKLTEVRTVIDGVAGSEDWPPLLPDAVQPTDQEMDIARLKAVWADDAADDYAEAAITGTLAIALKTLGRATDPTDAQQQAEAMWQARDRACIGIAA
ncbi:MAG: glycosyl transferase family protein [Rhodospirillales bacterium]|nr:MAG: glycosyl transferase family protein [Rhodospirillales bacterium]